jgi:outer membrane lipoprotein-sorting protein
MYKYLSLLLVLFLSVVSPVCTESVERILKEFEKTLAISTINGTLKVQLISQSGEVREIEARAYQKLVGEYQNNRLFIFDFPPTVRGTGLLLHSYFDQRPNNMWIYLPAIQRVKRIALESSGGGYFMGSDFSYQDLINNDNNSLQFKLLPDARVNGHDSYAIQAWGKTPELQAAEGYDHIISYYRKDNFYLHQREYFDFNGDLVKVYVVNEYLDLKPYIYPTKISMTNVQTGHKSIITVTNVKTDAIPDDYFTTRYLQNQ